MLSATGESAAERVYREVKGQILTNQIVGGELISEGDIATECDVSRTPVREAFLRLEAEGWMRLYPKRGALVVPVADREARDVVQARILLEEHAVRTLAGDPAGRADLAARLERNLAAHRAADPADIAEFARIDAEFHQLIVTAGDNPLLAHFFVSLGERHRRMTTTSVRRDDTVAARILADHRELLTAVADGDSDAYAAALAAHLASVHDLGPRT